MQKAWAIHGWRELILTARASRGAGLAGVGVGASVGVIVLMV